MLFFDRLISEPSGRFHIICKRLPLLLAVVFAFVSPGAQAAQQPSSEIEGITLACYNVRNYLRMTRWSEGKKQRSVGKPENEVAAVIEVLDAVAADVLVIVEIGKLPQLEDLRRRLKAVGHDYPHLELVESLGDETRHVAMLSKFPITQRNSQTALAFELNGVNEYMSRGILDATVEVNPDYQLRVLGVHLKSKRPVPQGQALIRRNEAHLLRKHIDSILEQDPQVNLILMGDLNDTKNQPAIKEVIGRRGSRRYMADLWLRDSLGDRWTHYWSTADIYSRIDYIMVSRALWPEVRLKQSYVERSPAGRIASDHRAVVTVVHPVNVAPAPLKSKRN